MTRVAGVQVAVKHIHKSKVLNLVPQVSWLMFYTTFLLENYCHWDWMCVPEVCSHEIVCVKDIVLLLLRRQKKVEQMSAVAG